MKKIIITAPKQHGSTTNKSISTRNYMNSAFKTYSLADNVRNIPGIDGLKPSQRKAIYGTLLRGENAGELQVERLSAFIAERTDYHHGTGSMASTLVGMASPIPGWNNMNIFVPEGQFGSRLTKEPGAGRYIATYLSPYFRQLFKKEDEIILDHHLVDGVKIEPKVYLPILPLVLINGALGIGTGHSVDIKSYHPNDVRDATLKVLEGKKLVAGKLTPWFRNFHGTVSRNETGQVETKGILKVVNATTIEISELPIGRFLDDYKDVLNTLLEPKRDKAGEIVESALVKDYRDASTEDAFAFTVTVPRTTTQLTEEQLYTKFKLVARETENFTLWNSEGNLQRFESAEDVIAMYVPWRLSFYEIRRQKLIGDTNESIRWMSEIIRFIRYYLANTKMFSGTGKKELVEILLQQKFVDYDKLLSMPMWNLTKDRIAELEKKLDETKAYLATLESDTADKMYTRELKAFEYKETR